MREEIIAFESFDLNTFDHVRPSAVLRRMQEIARKDLGSFGVQYEDLRERGMVFVVSRMALRFVRPVSGEVPLVLRTAPGQSHGATFPRSFVLEDEKGVVMQAMSLWALLDFKQRTLLRASALGGAIPDYADLSGGLVCERLVGRPAEEEPLFVDRRRVYDSMLDQNNHLNNCNYADLALDLLPVGVGEVQEMHITFQHEARLGDTLLMKGYEKDGAYHVFGTFQDREENCFLSKIKLF